MTYLPDAAAGSRPEFDFAALDRTDRILLGGCAAIWLAALGAGVAAAVALVDLSRGHTVASDSGTPWVLYTIIAVSAVVIVVAVPLLLRARRAAQEEPVPARPAEPPAAPPPVPARGAEAPTEKLRAVSPTALGAEPSGPIPRAPQRAALATAETQAVDRVWLRCAAGLGAAIGGATLLSAVATYLMAVDSDAVAWVLYGLAGVVTIGMAAIPWYFLRELRAIVEN